MWRVLITIFSVAGVILLVVVLRIVEVNTQMLLDVFFNAEGFGF